MKKFTLSLVLMLVSVYIFSQSSPRLVLQEEFTSSTCGPCVSANNKFKQWLNQYPAIYTAIFYHVNWPSPGNDPMYAANPVDNGARISYYGVNSVPYAVVDGNYWKGTGGNLNINTIQNRSNMPCYFQLQVQQTVPPTNDSIYLTTLIKATDPISALMTCHNVVIEKNIHFNSPPGTNGEKDFPNVMKKMLPSKDGTTLPASYNAGDYTILETSWKYTGVYDINEVAAISFIQDKTTKEVYQSANSSASVLTMPYDNDLEALSYKSISKTNCSGKINPVIKIRNNGNNPVTAFTVKYRVNNEAEQTYTWSGNITTLKKAEITLPEITFTPQENNVLKVYTVNPNSIADQYPKNDTLNIEIDGAPVTYLKTFVIVRTDNAPEEVSWDVKDMNGNVIQTSDAYTLPNHTYRDTVLLPQTGCYTFTIQDAGGNGVCCDNGIGVFQVLNNTGVTMYQNNSFGAKDFFEFKMDYAQAVENHEKTALQISPNPFHGDADITFYLISSESVKLSLYDMTGKMVKSWDAGYFNSGNNSYELNAQGINPGVYVLQLQAGTEVHTKRVAVK